MSLPLLRGHKRVLIDSAAITNDESWPSLSGLKVVTVSKLID